MMVGLAPRISLPYVRNMPVATLTSKGQITLPIEMREKLRLVAGSKIVFEERANGDYVVRKKASDIKDLIGCLKPEPGFAPTVEEMDEAISAEAAERDAFTRRRD
jgi:AbrB family looped-hinge helix DNA binding protein